MITSVGEAPSGRLWVLFFRRSTRGTSRDSLLILLTTEIHFMNYQTQREEARSKQKQPAGNEKERKGKETETAFADSPSSQPATLPPPPKQSRDSSMEMGMVAVRAGVLTPTCYTAIPTITPTEGWHRPLLEGGRRGGKPSCPGSWPSLLPTLSPLESSI